MELIRKSGIKIAGANAVVIGRLNLCSPNHIWWVRAPTLFWVFYPEGTIRNVTEVLVNLAGSYPFLVNFSF